MCGCYEAVVLVRASSRLVIAAQAWEGLMAGGDTPAPSLGTWEQHSLRRMRSASRVLERVGWRSPAPPVEILLKRAFVNVFLNLPTLLLPSQVFVAKSQTTWQLVERNPYCVSLPIVQTVMGNYKGLMLGGVRFAYTNLCHLVTSQGRAWPVPPSPPGGA